jgi:hypothetical protein
LTADAVHAGTAHPLFEAHPAPSLLFAPDGLITHANAAACVLLRAVPGRLAGAAMSEFFQEVGGSLGKIRAPLCHRRVAVRRPDGSNFIARIHVTPLAYGPRASLLASIEDLSEFEQEIAAANKEFESFTPLPGMTCVARCAFKGLSEALKMNVAALNEEGKTFSRSSPPGDRWKVIDLLLTSRAAGAPR